MIVVRQVAFLIRFDKLQIWYDSIGKMKKNSLYLIHSISIQLEEENESIKIGTYASDFQYHHG